MGIECADDLRKNSRALSTEACRSRPAGPFVRTVLDRHSCQGRHRRRFADHVAQGQGDLKTDTCVWFVFGELEQSPADFLIIGQPSSAEPHGTGSHARFAIGHCSENNTA